MNGSISPKRQRPNISSSEEFSIPPVLGSASQPLVTTRSPPSPQYEIHSTLSDVLSVRLHWMEKQIHAHASHLADFLSRDRILTSCFLNPQRFYGEMLQSSTPASENDGTTRTCIHTMNDVTPVRCVELTHHVHKPQCFRKSTHASIQLRLTRTQCNTWLNPTPKSLLNSNDVILCTWPNRHPWSKQLCSFLPELGTIECSQGGHADIVRHV